MTQIKILLVGCGSVGTMAAYTLQNSKNADVTVVLRSNYADVLAEGFTIDSVDHGKIDHWTPNHVEPSLEDALKHGPFAYVVVALKNLPDIYSIADIIRPAITPKHTTIVLIQNGIGIERPVLEAFRSNTILSCVPLIGSEQNGRHVLHNDPDIIYVAAFWNDALSCEEQKALCEEFATMYRLGGAEAHVVDDIMHYRWRKLIWNASFNTVCALTGLDSGTIQNTDALRTLIRPAMDDVVAIAKAAGYTYPDDIQDQMVAFTPKEAYLKPSMQVDALKGRPMEVEVILGEALKVAREKNMKVKVLQILYDLLSAVQWTRVNSDS